MTSVMESTGVILAIDLGKFHSQGCFYQVKEGSHEFERVVTRPGAMGDLLVKRKVDRVVIEAGAQAGWVVDLCRALGLEVQVANANGQAWRWKNVKNKSDREDALKLARLSVMGQLGPGVHVPVKAIRQWRGLIQYRQALVGRRTAIRNGLHAILSVQGEETVIRSWSQGMIQELKKLGKGLGGCGAEELWRGQFELELRAMEQVEGLIGEVEGKLDELAAGDASREARRVALLRSIPGVGPRLAEMVVAWIDDPDRFANGRQVGSYAGLTPRRHQSGVSDRSGRISKQGCGRLRKLLVQVAWGMLWHNERGKAVFERLSKGHKTRRKQAAVGLARKVLVWCWAMLRDGRPWEPHHHGRRMEELAEAAG
jgi:transposase